MKIFLDTNVIVSALATRGLCADVFRLVLVDHEIVISQALLVEVERVLIEKLNLPKDIVVLFLDFLKRDSTFSENEQLIDIEIPDPTDIPILSSAYYGGAQVFITGDRQLLDLGKINDMLILSPRKFWETITKF